MFCLYNGEYGEHDLSNVGGLEKIVERQKMSYENYKGMIVGDYTILSMEYDWGKRSQRAEIECNFCHKKTFLYNVSNWRRGKGRSTRCECHKIRDNIDKLLAPDKPKMISNSDPFWIGKEVEGWRVIQYIGEGYFLVECVDCGKRKKLSSGQIRRNEVKPCNHIISNNYSDEKWIGKRNGHLTAVAYIGKYFEAVCDCGRKVTVRGTDLFKNKTAITCKDLECPYYQESQLHIQGAKRRKEGLDYEHAVIKLFRRHGYVVENTPDQGDFGVDFITLLTKGERLAVQCKMGKSPTTVKAIQEVYAGGRYYDCTKFAVVSPSGFTFNALQMAAKLGVYCAIHTFKFDELDKASSHAVSLINTLPHIDNLSRKHRMETQWTIDGITKFASEWCLEYNVKRSTVESRLSRGMDLKDALNSSRANAAPTYVVGGVEGTVTQLAKHYGVIPQTVYYRMKYRGMNIEDALQTENRK